MSVDEKMQKMITELNLTSSQQSQVRSILDEQKPKLDAATSDEARKSVQKDTDDRVKAVLNSDQRTRYDQMMQKAKDETGKTGSTGSASETGSSSGTGY